MLGKFGVGCCCDPLCLWRNDSPWTSYPFIEWYQEHAGYKRYKLGTDNKYTVVENRYIDAGMTQVYRFDQWMELLEFDSAIEPSDSDYYAVTKEQIIADLTSMREEFANRHYDEVPLYFVYLFVVEHNGFTRQPRQYLLPVHANMELKPDFSSLFTQAIANSRMPGLTGTVTRPTYYDFFALIITVSTKDNGTRLWLTWDDRCIAELCTRIVSWNQSIYQANTNVHVGHKSFERVDNVSKTWDTRHGTYPAYNGWPFEPIKGVECSYRATIRFNPVYSGICFQHHVDPYGNESWIGPMITQDKLYLFDEFCRPQWSNIVAINNYSATGGGEPNGVAGHAEPAPVFEDIHGTIDGDDIWLPVNYGIYAAQFVGREYHIACTVQNFIIGGENRYTSISQETAQERAEDILDELERVAQAIIGTPIPPPPDIDYYSNIINCQGSACTKHLLYECSHDYLLDADQECGSRKIETTNLAASAVPCRYSTPTDRQWLKCTNCRVVECRSPVLPNIRDAVALHSRLPVDSTGKVIDNAGYLEIRSAFCNAQSCSAYKADE